MKKLEVFIDYTCPFCLRGFEDLLELLPQFPEIAVIWRLCEAHPRPEPSTTHSDLAMQGYYLAKDLGVDPVTYHKRMFKAHFADKIDLNDKHALARAVSDLINPETFVQTIDDKKYKAIQEDGNSYAYEENNVWFIPSFIMNGRRLDSEGGVGVSIEELEKFLSDGSEA